MGRRRKIKLDDLEWRTVRCDCGRPVEVQDKQVESVQCCFCSIGMRPIPDGYWQDIEDAQKAEAEEKEKPKKRGRPKGSKNKKTLSKEKKRKEKVLKHCRKKENSMDKNKEENDAVQAAKDFVKKTAKKSTGKRGRKPTVGAKVLSYIKEQNTNVKFDDILTVYSEERKRLGKFDASTEKRNCLSTLYIMKRDGKIREVEPKTVYAAI
jgi:hypothetical protein